MVRAKSPERMPRSVLKQVVHDTEVWTHFFEYGHLQKNRLQEYFSSYFHFADGGMDIRIASVDPPVFKPNKVPLSQIKLNST